MTGPTSAAPSVAFVVPTKDSGRTLEACLRSLRAQQGVTPEVIVVDNHSGDQTLAIAERWADRVLLGGPERSAQRNQGLAAASEHAEIVMFVDSDMVLEPHVGAQACAVFAAEPAVGALVVDEHIVGHGFLARCRQLEKDVRRGDPACEAARVFRRRAVAGVGGFDETLYAGEDWDLADRVTADGWGLGRVEALIWHDEGRIGLRAAFRKKVYYGRNFVGYAGRPRTQRRPLMQTTLLTDRRLLRSPLRTAGLLTLKSVELSGLVWGGLLASAARRGKG